MDWPGVIFLSIPIVGIVSISSVMIFNRWISHRQEMVRIRFAQGSSANAASADIESLRTEIMKLRDTTTQYDMSVERTLADLRNRVAHIESRTEVPTISPNESTPTPSRPTPEYVEQPVSDQPVEAKVNLGG